MNVPLSLYIHLPWCVRKCPYCDFNSHTLKETLPESIYIEKLLQDWQQEIKRVPNRALTSIFIGGGTPSLFSSAAMKQLLNGIRESIAFSHDHIEITLEANPGTVDYAKFADFRTSGINRLSLGVQSFQNAKLQALGRIHDGEQAQQALAIVQKNFTTFNIDLMHGLPQQTAADAIADLRQALQFAPPHLSWYQLTLEPNTAFYQKPPMLPPESVLADIQAQGHALLLAAGYCHYEVSAYAKPNHCCQHNRNYWQFGDYLAIGAGAHGKVTNLLSGDIVRYTKIKHPKSYLQATDFIATQEIVPLVRRPFEFMLNALRLQQPVTWQLLTERTGLPWQSLLQPLTRLVKRQLLEFNEQQAWLTPLGHQFLNDVLTEFLEDQS